MLCFQGKSKWKPGGLFMGVAPMGQALQQLPFRVLLWPFPVWISLGTCGAPEALALAALYSKAVSLGPLNLERWIWVGRGGWTWAWSFSHTRQSLRGPFQPGCPGHFPEP